MNVGKKSAKRKKEENFVFIRKSPGNDVSKPEMGGETKREVVLFLKKKRNKGKNWWLQTWP